MLLQLKQFIKGIDTSSLIPLAAFTTIVGFVFYPLRRLSDTAALPLGMLASSFCMFVVGCYIAEIFKTKISRKGLKYIAIVAVLFGLHIFLADGLHSWRYAPPESILWYPWFYIRLTGVNPFFLCLGMIANYCSYRIPYRPYPFRTNGSIKRDIFIALLSLFAFVSSMYGTCVPAFFEEMSVQAAWIVRYVVRVVCFAPWVILMVSLYRCLTSNWVSKIAAKAPKIMTFLAYLAPIAIWRIWSIHFPVYGLYELLSFHILVVIFTIYIRLAFRLIRTLVKRVARKREMSQGDATQNLKNVPSDEACFFIIIVFSLFVSCCGNPVQRGTSEESSQRESTGVKNRSIYHWKTTFNLTPDDEAFIQQHNIKTIYLRMFDVGMDTDNGVETGEVVPLGTTKFISKIPSGCSYVPTVYITLKALKKYNMRESELADLIIRRIMAMCSWNELGDFHEIQYDCDWTTETRASFERLCGHSRKELKKRNVILSGTIRLHQIDEATYPFDKGVLMIYNTGSFKNPNTENSILDYDDVYKYLSVEKRIQRFLLARKENCPVIEVAYPTYGWGVVFDENQKFDRLVSNPEEHRLEEGEAIRLEMGTYSEIMKVKNLVDSTIAPTCSGNILYHLDSENLNRYKSHEIEDIYN